MAQLTDWSDNAKMKIGFHFVCDWSSNAKVNITADSRRRRVHGVTH